MKDYNPGLAAQKNNPEQKIIRDARNIEYDRQFKKTSEQRLNQEYPNPTGIFDAEVQGIARAIVEKASDLTNEKKKGDIGNAEYAAEMANIQQMVGNLKSFKANINTNMRAYNEALKNGVLSYGMDQNDEAVLIGLNKGEINLDLDENNRVKLTGKANNPVTGEFDVNIYDAINIPGPVTKIAPINLLLDPVAKSLGLDQTGQPQVKIDEFGRKILDTGDISEHKQDIIEFSQNALDEVGPRGIRSYLGDHMNLSNQEIKNLMEHLNFNDGDHEWENAGQAKVFQSLNDYIGNKYQRQRRPHPDTLAAQVSNQASQIAAGKQVQLASDDVTQPMPGGGMLQTDAMVMNDPSAGVEDIGVMQAFVPEPEPSPLKKTKKSNKALKLIKKYSA